MPKIYPKYFLNIYKMCNFVNVIILGRLIQLCLEIYFALLHTNSYIMHC